MVWLCSDWYAANDNLNSTSSWNSTSNQVGRDFHWELERWTQTKNSPSCWSIWFDKEQRQSSRSQEGSVRTGWISQPNQPPRTELGAIWVKRQRQGEGLNICWDGSELISDSVNCINMASYRFYPRQVWTGLDLTTGRLRTLVVVCQAPYCIVWQKL